jgi:hypothetical protein
VDGRGSTPQDALGVRGSTPQDVGVRGSRIPDLSPTFVDRQLRRQSDVNPVSLTNLLGLAAAGAVGVDGTLN